MRWLAGLVAVLCTAGAWAQDYPSRPVKVVLFYAPGGPTDFAARLIADKLQQRFGQPFVVESRAGANLRIGTEFVAKSPPDGYTIGVTGGPHATNPALFPDLPYDTLKDLKGLAHLVDAPLVLSVPAISPVKTVQGLIEAAKAKQGQFIVATAGNGTTTHLTMEFLFLTAGVNFTHVPYKGDAPAVTEALGGRVDATCNTLQAVQQHIKSGRLRGLAVGTRQRVGLLPDLPTYVEQGLPDLTVSAWFGMIVPAAVPREIVQRLNREINDALQLPDVREKAAAAGLVPVGGSAEDFDALIKAEMDRWAQIIRTRGIKAQ